MHRVSQYPPKKQFAGARVDAGGLEDHAVAVEGGGEGRADRVDHRSRGVKWTWQAAGERAWWIDPGLVSTSRGRKVPPLTGWRELNRYLKARRQADRVFTAPQLMGPWPGPSISARPKARRSPSTVLINP